MSPGIFTPIRTRTRCQDPGRHFIRRQDENAIHARQRPRSYKNTPGIIPGVFCYAVLRLSATLYGVFMFC
jgi:hypothetical protein